MSVLILNAGREKANALWRIVKSTAFREVARFPYTKICEN